MIATAPLAWSLGDVARFAGGATYGDPATVISSVVTDSRSHRHPTYARANCKLANRSTTASIGDGLRGAGSPRSCSISARSPARDNGWSGIVFQCSMIASTT